MQNSSQHRLATISLWIAACLVSLALQSCSEQDVKAFRNLFPLQNELKSKYQAEEVELTLENSHILDITLKNSPSSALGLDELKFRAAEVAQYAGNHYDSIGAIDTISVTFSETHSYLLIIGMTRMAGPFRFEREALPDGSMRWHAIASAKPGQQA